MKSEVVLAMAKNVLQNYDIISGKIFKKGTSQEIQNMLRILIETYQIKRKDAEELLDHVMVFNEPGDWPRLDILKEAISSPQKNELVFPLSKKQLIIINRLLFHPKEEYMFIMTGIGGSGKSTYLNIIKQLFQNDVSPCSLSDLTNEFNVAEAVKHRLIASDELARGELNLPIVKQLVSKQMIHCNPKNRTPYDVKSQSSLVYCCNKAPKLDVTDTGILRRIVYFEMNKKIKNPDPSMKDKEYTKEDLMDIVRAAYALESKWENEDWFDYFRTDTHKYLMKDNSVYLCSDCITYDEYVQLAREKGLKPYAEPSWIEISDLFKEWIKEEEAEKLKEELF